MKNKLFIKNKKLETSILIKKNHISKFIKKIAKENEKVFCIVDSKVKISENVYIGAGAVILKDIKKDQIIVGNPQRILRNNTKKNNFTFFSKL